MVVGAQVAVESDGVTGQLDDLDGVKSKTSCSETASNTHTSTFYSSGHNKSKLKLWDEPTELFQTTARVTNS